MRRGARGAARRGAMQPAGRRRTLELVGKVEGLAPANLIKVGGEVVVRVDQVSVALLALLRVAAVQVVHLVVLVNAASDADSLLVLLLARGGEELRHLARGRLTERPAKGNGAAGLD